MEETFICKNCKFERESFLRHKDSPEYCIGCYASDEEIEEYTVTLDEAVRKLNEVTHA